MRERIDIEIREGDRYIGFYANNKWIQGCRKCYLLAVMYELIDRYASYPCDVYFTIGGYENDEDVRKDCIKLTAEVLFFTGFLYISYMFWWYLGLILGV